MCRERDYIKHSYTRHEVGEEEEEPQVKHAHSRNSPLYTDGRFVAWPGLFIFSTAFRKVSRKLTVECDRSLVRCGRSTEQSNNLPSAFGISLM